MKIRFIAVHALISLFLSGISQASAQSPSLAMQTPQIGVNVQETPAGLVVRSVIANSGAVGHLKSGDVLRFMTADGLPVYSVQSFSLMKEAKEAIGTNQPSYLEIQRDGQRIAFSIVFRPNGVELSSADVSVFDRPIAPSSDENKALPKNDTPKASEPAPAASENETPKPAPVAATAPAEASSASTKTESIFSPKGPSPMTLDRLVTAKLVSTKAGSERMVVFKTKWMRGELYEEVYTDTKMVEETREAYKNVVHEVDVMGVTKKVFDTIKVDVTELVPKVVEARTTVMMMELAEGKDQVEVGLEDVKAWTADGNPLSLADLKAALTSERHVFVLRPGQDYEHDPYFATVFRTDVLVMTFPRGLGILPSIVQPEPEEPANAAAAGSSTNDPQPKPAPKPNAIPAVEPESAVNEGNLPESSPAVKPAPDAEGSAITEPESQP